MRARLAVLVLFGSLAATAAGGSVAGSGGQAPSRLVFASDRAPDYRLEVYSLDLTGGAPQNISRDENADDLLALSGRRVTFASDRSGNSVYVARVGSSASARRLINLPSDAQVGVAASWSPSGDELAVGFADRNSKQVIQLFNASGRRLAQIGNAELSGGGWSADGQRLAYGLAHPGQYLSVVKVADSRGRLRFTRHGDSAQWARAAPRLAIVTDVGIASDVGSTVIFNEQGRVLRRFEGTLTDLSPDGKLLVLQRQLGVSWLASVDTGALRRLPAAGGQAAFSPDGHHLELDDGSREVIVNVSSGRVEGHLAGYGQWLSDSRHLVILDNSRRAVTLVTSGGRVLRRLQLIPPTDAAAAASVGLLLAAQDASALVYTVESDHIHQLYEQLPSGALRQITRGLNDHQDPVSSPDGRLIADSEYDTPCGICTPLQIGVLASDGSAPARLLGTPGGNPTHPTWSPDGTHIAFARTDPAGITVMQADGSQPVALSGGARAAEPSWSPDGSAIAAARRGIVVMASDGTHAQQLTDEVPAGSDAALTGFPTWSPDSAMLAFAGADGLYVINRDGSGLHAILAMTGIVSVAWSPDGALIAFAAGCLSYTPHCSNEIWTVRPDGSDPRRITDDIADDTTPTWLPAA